MTGRLCVSECPLLVDKVNLTNQARNWDTCMQPMTKVSVAGVSKRREGGTKSRDEEPCFTLYFPYIHFTYTNKKLDFDTHMPGCSCSA